MQSSILLAEHRARGAEFAAGREPALLLTYGDVPAEYAAAQTGAVLFDETDRGLVRVRGADAAAFLHRLLANTVRTLEPGQGNANLLLTPKGKIAHAFDLVVLADGIELSTPPGQAPELARALDTYLFSEKVELEDATAEAAPLALAGPRAAAIARALAPAVDLPDPLVPDHGTRHIAWQGRDLALTALPVAGSAGLRLDAGPDAALELWRALVAAGAVPAGRILADILRVEAGAAARDVDVDDTIYPQEARLERSFSLDKGCYIGQEVVAKIDTYGGLNKRLVALAVEHDDPVARGTRLFREDAGEWRDLGVVTSWAYSFVLDTGLVLAYVKRKHQAVGTTFRVGEGPATARVVEIPVRADALTVTGDFE